jgi:TATA-box binding protein (TBP) (component of TFIID and TFIIIB)
VTSLAFSTGRVLYTGASSLEEALWHAHLDRLLIGRVPQTVIEETRTRDGLRQWHFAARSIESIVGFYNFKVVNIVSNGVISNQMLNLAGILADHNEVSDWEPATFPALKMRLLPSICPGLSRRCTASIFDTGRCLVAGCRREEDGYAAFDYLVKLVRKYIDPDAPERRENRYRYRIDQLKKYAQRRNQRSRQFLSAEERNVGSGSTAAAFNEEEDELFNEIEFLLSAGRPAPASGSDPDQIIVVDAANEEEFNFSFDEEQLKDILENVMPNEAQV